MAILNYIEQATVQKHPVEFQCDICKSVFKLEKEYDIKYRSNVEQQMAVIKYDEPAGYDYCQIEKHCCSTDCLVKAIQGVPFGAKITIPIDGFYKKRMNIYDSKRT